MDYPWRQRLRFDLRGHRLIYCAECLASGALEPEEAVTIYQGTALCAVHMVRTLNKEKKDE